MCALKYHLFLLVPVLAIAQRRWRLLGAAAACGGVLTMVCFLTNGWDWPLRYVPYLFAKGNSPGERDMPNLHGLLLNIPHAGAIELAALVVTVLLAWFVMRRCSFEHGLALALAVALVINRHTFLADFALLLPAILLMARDSREWVRSVALIAMLPIPYLGVYAPQFILITRLFLLALLVVLFISTLRQTSKPVVEPHSEALRAAD